MLHKKFTLLTMLLLLSSSSWAVDFNDWRAHVPDQLGGFKATSKATGLNQTLFSKKYVNDDLKIALTINYDSDAITVKATESLMEIDMDTEYGVYKKFDVQGFKAVYLYDKSANSVTVMVILKDKTSLSLLTSGGKKMSYYVDLVDKIALVKIAASL